jgi:hypothetical protein
MDLINVSRPAPQQNPQKTRTAAAETERFSVRSCGGAQHEFSIHRRTEDFLLFCSFNPGRFCYILFCRTMGQMGRIDLK